MSDAPELDVVGIGSVVADRIHRVPRILGADEKGIVRAGAEGAPVALHVGGVVLNHLGWAAALGLRTGVFGKQADDAHGRFLRGAMDRHGIAHHFTLDGSASSFADIYVDDAGGRAIYMAPGATSETTPDDVERDHAGWIRAAARVTTEVSQLPLATALRVLEIARDASVPTVVDLDVPPSDAVPGLGDEATLLAVLRAADVLKPSKSAAAELVPGAGDDAGAVASALRERFGCGAVAVTDGAAGCAIASPAGVVRVPAPRPRGVVDTTGAGDAFLGGLLFARTRGLDWEAAGALANACGAACVERLGAFPEDAPSARERVRALYQGPAVDFSTRRAADREGARALAAFGVFVDELGALRRRLATGPFDAAVRLVRGAVAAGGRVHVTGIGKPEHVARYAASLLASTGTPATFLHGTEVVHGSAGQVVAGDIVIAISNSGETAELRCAVEAVLAMGARLVAVTGAPTSWLAKQAEVVLDAGVAAEGGGLGLAPRASVAAELLVVAALSAALEEAGGLTRAQYHARHPAGELGRRSR